MTGIGFHEAREMWLPNWIDILHHKQGVRSVPLNNIPGWIETEGEYPAIPSTIRDYENGWILCVPPGYDYLLVKKTSFVTFRNIRFYSADGTYFVFPLPDNLPANCFHDGSLVTITLDEWGPTREGATYYNLFGLDRVEIPADCPRLTAVMPRVIQLFNERYAYRMLNSETLEQWQMRLQHTADLNAYRYERALTLYATNAEEMSNVLEKKTTERDATSENSGSDSTTYGRKDTFAGSVKNIDTPDSAINASDDYADSLTKSDNSNTASGTDTLTHGLKNTVKDKVVETREPEGGFVPALNDSIDAYRDIAVDFVREFENNFLNVFWY